MLNRSQKKELKEDYYFMSMDDLVEKHKISIYDLRNFARAEGLKSKAHAKLTEEQRQYIIDNPLKDYSVLAKELDITYAMVARILKRRSKK